MPQIHEFLPHRDRLDTLSAYPAIEASLQGLDGPIPQVGMAHFINIAPHMALRGTTNTGFESVVASGDEIGLLQAQKIAEALYRGEPLFRKRDEHTEAALQVFEGHDVDLASLAQTPEMTVMDILTKEFPGWTEFPYRIQVSMANLLLAQRLQEYSGLVEPPISAPPESPMSKEILLPSRDLFQMFKDEATISEKGPQVLLNVAQMMDEYAIAMPLKLTSDRHDLPFYGIVSNMMTKIVQAYKSGYNLRKISSVARKQAEAYISRHGELAAFQTISYAKVNDEASIQPYLAYSIANKLCINAMRKIAEQPKIEVN